MFYKRHAGARDNRAWLNQIAQGLEMEFSLENKGKYPLGFGEIYQRRLSNKALNDALTDEEWESLYTLNGLANYDVHHSWLSVDGDGVMTMNALEGHNCVVMRAVSVKRKLVGRPEQLVVKDASKTSPPRVPALDENKDAQAGADRKPVIVGDKRKDAPPSAAGDDGARSPKQQHVEQPQGGDGDEQVNLAGGAGEQKAEKGKGLEAKKDKKANKEKKGKRD